MTIATTIAIVLLITSVTLMAMPAQSVEAQPAAQQPTVAIPSGATADVTVETIPHISFRPRTIGVGQPLLVNVWIEATFLSPNYQLFQAYKVTITKPDGTQDVITKDSYLGDTTSWFEYVPDQVGEWTLKLDFLGQYFPNGTYYNGINYPSIEAIGPYTASFFGGPRYYSSAYYEPGSDGPYGLVVQEEQVLSWPPSPLPTDYWTRPVSPWNREWWPILGNFPGWGIYGGDHSNPYWPADTNLYAKIQYAYLPYVQGPKSSHILRTEQFNVGGLIGGSMGQTTIWESSTVIYGHPSMIYSGRAYWTTTVVIDGQPTSVWQCYDLRTGEVYWNQYPVAQVPTFIIYDYGAPEIEGAIPHLAKPVLGYIGDGRLIKYDAWTGAVAGNYSIAPLTGGTTGRRPTSTFYSDPYVLTVQDLGSAAGADRYRLINWTVIGSSNDITSRVMSNISWPISSLPSTTDFEAGIAVSGSATRITSYSLTTGDLLVDITTGILFGTEGTPAQADHGKFAQRYNDGHWHCWDMRTGAELWTSEISSEPWGTFGTYGSASYGGMLMSNQFDSVTALNWTNGKIVWSYVATADSPYEAVMTYDNQTVYPWHTCGMIADGVYYSTTSEHSADMPIKRGMRIHAINITTGEKIWSLTMQQTGSTSGSRVFQGAIADGYLAYSDAQTCTMYVVGKGESATTVTASQKTIAKGATVLIEGTVLDQSPGQPGTPCVSKESMTLQMEHIHIAQPLDGIYHNETITGVPVTLTAIGSDGTVIDLGAVTTNGYYGTFSYAWTPPEEGTYEIIASFAADDSYGSSEASTYISVTGGITAEEIAQKVLDELPISPSADDVASAIINQLPEGITAQDVADKVLANLPEGPSAENVAEEILKQLPEEPKEPETPLFTTMDLAIIAAVVVVAALVVYNIYLIRKRK